jgi:hypothetical protein
VLTEELADGNLLHWNFEWLASSAHSLGSNRPELPNGVVRLPIHLDDFALYRGEGDLGRWLEQAVATVEAHDVAALSLHDCYAHLWLPRYPELLERLQALGTLRTLDDVAAGVTLAAAA